QRGFFIEALVGFQGRGCADVVPPHCCHPLLLEALLFQWPEIRRCASQTMAEHTTLESHTSVIGYRTALMVISVGRFPNAPLRGFVHTSPSCAGGLSWACFPGAAEPLQCSERGGSGRSPPWRAA